jgi:hypothetical protein
LTMSNNLRVDINISSHSVTDFISGNFVLRSATTPTCSDT